MSLPLVTRFGADPLLDLEVANKKYVDSKLNPAKSGFSLVSGWPAANGAFTVVYSPMTGIYPIEYATEAETAIILPVCTLARCSVTNRTNTYNGITEYFCHDDGVNIANSVVTLPASTTGAFTTGDISESIAAESLVSGQRDRTASSSGATWWTAWLMVFAT